MPASVSSKRTIKSMRKIERAIFASNAQTLEAVLPKMQEVVVNDIETGGRTGRLYKRKRAPGFHQASAPGEMPKKDSGELSKSFINGVTRIGGNVQGTIMNFSGHAVPLELKPKQKGGRPFMRPLFKQFLRPVKKLIRTSAKRALRGL